ncbi:MAG: hypothetical protein BAA03_09110 [Caldibacillus debilis]|nr:MAG: hypothetical protein BAA03_09110 [Caldibacillus debilis]
MFLALRKRQPTGDRRVEDDPAKLRSRRFRQKKEIFALLKKKYMDPFGGIRSESPPKIEANEGGRLRQGSVHPCQGRWPSGRIKPDGLQ